MNWLYYGDCLGVMRGLDSGSVDLIYLDPPFNSKRGYNVIFKTKDGNDAPAQVHAFEDSWAWDQAAAAEFEELRQTSPKMSDLMDSMRTILRTNDMLAYLTMMSLRLLECHRVLKSDGLIYLHCDPTASHYLKIVMDSIFGGKNFRNEIVWLYSGGGIPTKDYPRKHDVVLRYSKTDEYVYEPDYRPYSEGTVARGRTQIKGKYFDQGLRKEGTPIEDWWPDLPKITSPTDPEKLGYPTQKPLVLLERIIRSSSRPDAVVLDPFCGCGTTVHAAQLLGRRWIGIDITYIAIDLIQKRLTAAFPNVEYRVRGIPTDLDSARKLASANKFDFERWAVSLVGCVPNAKQVGDAGIDGRGLFPITDKVNGQLIVSVKGGQTVNPANVREVAGTARAARAELAILITLVQPSAKMREAAASHGMFIDPLTKREFPRVQVYSIEDHFRGIAPKLPTLHLAYIKARSPVGDQLTLQL